jgi:ribonuclease BN (tRNA processing enzyme)
MEVTLLGTGSPIPILERAGTSLAVTVGGETLMIDCGPRAVYELIRNEIDPGTIGELLFTHHHVDHNASFYHLAIVGWTAGRESLTVYGPPGTDTLIDSLYAVYEDDLAYRSQVGYPVEGIENIEWVRVDPSFSMDREDFRVDALPVDHSIETYAYRIEGDDGAVVFSADTGKCDRLVDFADGADLLVHDAHMSPVGDPPEEGFVWERYTRPYPEQAHRALSATHCTPVEAAEIAEAAGVQTLVLTHFPPYRDVESIRAQATAAFDGEVLVGADGMTIEVPPRERIGPREDRM